MRHVEETVFSSTRIVACDGGSSQLDPAMGHPRVYLNLSKGEVRCPYCSRLYVYKPETEAKPQAAAS